MLQFVVLGLIPGTHLEISFTSLLWLTAISLLAALCILDRHQLKHRYERVLTWIKFRQSKESIHTQS